MDSRSNSLVTAVLEEGEVGILEELTQLSRDFGTLDHVRGGGGNTSAKDEKTIWVKPSGTVLGEMRPEVFVALDRGELAKLYAMTPPRDPAEREKAVKEALGRAVKSSGGARPSVETALHGSFEARFVAHTHPPLVNGMTCSKKGRARCAEIFPEALWVDYVDPGYTACMKVREKMQEYARRFGRQPGLVFWENHGVFFAGATADEVRGLSAKVLGRLREEYERAGVATELAVGEQPAEEVVGEMKERVRKLLGADAECVAASGAFTCAGGPETPDHIVYMKSAPLAGEPTEERVKAYREKYGYNPRVVCTKRGVFAVGPSQREAGLALELAEDGAMVRQLARAFGGVKYMTRKSARFVENWEAEAYRRQQIRK